MDLVVQEEQYNGEKRLGKGENSKIDKINELVCKFQDNNDSDAIYELWSMFLPMIRKIINKWQKCYRVNNISWDKEDIEQDAFIWFFKYTKEKYDPVNYSTRGKRATYNTFIKKHMDLRIRYIYQVKLRDEMNYVRQMQDRHGTEDDQLEKVMIDNRYYNRGIEHDKLDEFYEYVVKLIETNGKDVAFNIIIDNEKIFNELPNVCQEYILKEVMGDE